MEIAQKNCIIIHGCSSPEDKTYNKHWMPWTKNELNKKGIPTETPLMPEPWAPVYKNFKKEFEKLEVNENSILVGHSCGCAFLVHWLGDSKQKIHKLILVAPWKVGSDVSPVAKQFYTWTIDKSIKDRVDQIIMFTADNEAIQGKNGLKMFHDAFGGKIINIPGYGHYCFSNMNTEEFPQLIEAILE